MRLYNIHLFFILFLLVILLWSCNRNRSQSLKFLGFSKLKELLTPINEKEEWNYNRTGDGEELVEFIFKSQDSLTIINECKKNNLKKLPLDAEDLPDGAIFQFIDSANSEGYYKLKIDDNKMSYSLAVIDSKNKKIVVYRVFY